MLETGRTVWIVRIQTNVCSTTLYYTSFGNCAAFRDSCFFGIYTVFASSDRLCGLVVRVSGHRYRGPGFDPLRYQIF